MNGCLGRGNLSCLHSAKPVLCLLMQLLWMSPSLQLLTGVYGRNIHQQYITSWCSLSGATLQLVLKCSSFFFSFDHNFWRNGKLGYNSTAIVLSKFWCPLRHLSLRDLDPQPLLNLKTRNMQTTAKNAFTFLRPRVSFAFGVSVCGRQTADERTKISVFLSLILKFFSYPLASTPVPLIFLWCFLSVSTLTVPDVSPGHKTHKRKFCSVSGHPLQ